MLIVLVKNIKILAKALIDKIFNKRLKAVPIQREIRLFLIKQV